MNELKLALDWTPNINHIGFFVAKEKGFYADLEIDLQIMDPSIDNYQTTPAKKVELGVADFALCPTESIISYRTKEQPFDLIAIAAILQEDLSAIVVKESSGIHSPKDLDGKIYSSYKARYEDGIVKEMIKNDGGSGNLKITYPDKLGIWENLLNDESDATWIFLNWEGVAAKELTSQLKYFKMSDFGIPYSYSPVIATSESQVDQKLGQYKSFLEATKKGFLLCQQDPGIAERILSKYIPEHDDKINLGEALKITAPHFGNERNWGIMNEEVIAEFMNWITDKQLEKNFIQATKVATNRCLK